MKLTENINKTLGTGLIGLGLLVGCTQYQPQPKTHIELYKDGKNYLKIEAPDGRMLRDSSDKYIKIDVGDSIKYEIDGKQKVFLMYERKPDTTRTTTQSSDDDMLFWVLMMSAATM